MPYRVDHNLIYPVKVKNSMSDDFRGGSIFIGEKDAESTNAIKAYQTWIWHKNPKLPLNEMNLRTLTFENAPEESANEVVQSGQLKFRYPISKGKDLTNFSIVY